MTPSWFDWLGFFMGGAVGSVIIISVQSLIQYIISSKKEKREKKRVVLALKKEVESNISLCEFIIEKTKFDPEKAYDFADFDLTWLIVYKQKFIDFEKDSDIKVFEGVLSIQKKLGLQKSSYDWLNHYCKNTARSDPDYTLNLKKQNKNILDQTVGLKMYFNKLKFSNDNVVCE